MRVALYGYDGYWGSKLGRCLNELGHSVTQLYNSSESKLDGGANIAIIATPPDTHYKLTMSALMSGQDVLVEKPMCLSIAEAETLASLADERSLVLMVDHTLCFTEPFKFLMSQGGITGYRSIKVGPHMPQAKIGAGWDIICHDLAVLYALGCSPTGSSYGVERGSNAHAFIQMENGGNAFMFASRSWGEKRREAMVKTAEDEFYWNGDNLWLDGRPVAMQGDEPLKSVIKEFESRCNERRLNDVSNGWHGAAVCASLDYLFPRPSHGIGLGPSRVGNGVCRV